MFLHVFFCFFLDFHIIYSKEEFLPFNIMIFLFDYFDLLFSMTTEFLKVMVSWSCKHAKIFWLCAKFMISMWKIQIYAFNLFYMFLVFMFYTYYVILSYNFALFTTQDFKNYFLTTQKNLLFECLHDKYFGFRTHSHFSKQYVTKKNVRPNFTSYVC